MIKFIRYKVNSNYVIAFFAMGTISLFSPFLGMSKSFQQILPSLPIVVFILNIITWFILVLLAHDIRNNIITRKIHFLEYLIILFRGLLFFCVVFIPLFIGLFFLRRVFISSFISVEYYRLYDLLLNGLFYFPISVLAIGMLKQILAASSESISIKKIFLVFRKKQLFKIIIGSLLYYWLPIVIKLVYTILPYSMLTYSILIHYFNLIAGLASILLIMYLIDCDNYTLD